MGISTEGDWGTGAHATSASSFTMTTATTALVANTGVGILMVATDNVDTTDGQTNLHTSVTGGTGTWTKLSEYTNGEGAAAAGVTTSMWLFEATAAMATGSTITINLASAVVDKTCTGHVFTKDPALRMRLVPGSSPQFNVVDAAVGFGSATISGLSVKQYLFLRALAKEANTTGNITPTGSYGTLGASRSRNDASAVLIRGERRVVSIASQTSNPTFSTSGDGASIFLVLEEFTPTGAITGTGSVSLAFTAAGGGKARVKGIGAVTLAMSLAGTGTRVLPPAGVGGGLINFSVSGSGSAKAKGSLSSQVDLSVSGAGRTKVKGSGTGLASFSVTGAGVQGRPALNGTGAGILDFSLGGTGRALGKGAGTLSFSLRIAASGRARAKGSTSLALGLGFSVSGTGLRVLPAPPVPRTGTGSGLVGFTLSTGIGKARVKGIGALSFSFSATGQGPAPIWPHVRLMMRGAVWKTQTADVALRREARTGVWGRKEKSGTWN